MFPLQVVVPFKFRIRLPVSDFCATPVMPSVLLNVKLPAPVIVPPVQFTAPANVVPVPCRLPPLITTAVGLAVAIISVWVYNYFIGRVDDITIDIDETASELVDSVLREETV